ncbi:hypothetical protein UlMin_020199 [Ulmus minor]
MKAFLNNIKSHIQNQGISLRNLENQVGQLANALSSRQSGSLPSNIEVPQRDGKEHCKVIQLRSGKEITTLAGQEDDQLMEKTTDKVSERETRAGDKEKARIPVMADIKGISPTLCMHKILLEESQRRLNLIMKEVLKKEIIKWLDVGIIYPISDSVWVSPVQCVPKKGGIMVVMNDKNVLIPTRVVSGWRVCMDYRWLNKATRKDHFLLPFIDQMLDRLAGKDFYYFLDRYSGYNLISIAPEDQEKTTFTYPYDTFAFRRMPFDLCNTPATFQRCMMALFYDMIEKTIEIFVDDFSVFGESFQICLGNLEQVLDNYEETNLVLNWEKCHFMVQEGIVLGHRVSKKGIEVDKAKIEVIEKQPPPSSVKGIQSFLGHAGFYRRFIKDFSKISKPLCQLLEQNREFNFDEACLKAFRILKKH